MRWGFRWVAESRVQEVFTAASLLVVVGTAILAEEAGLSMGMGAFVAGMLLANSEYRHELEINLAPFKGLLMGFIFYCCRNVTKPYAFHRKTSHHTQHGSRIDGC